MVRSLSALAVCTPKVDAAPLFTVRPLPGASTVPPMSAAAWVCWLADNCGERELSDVCTWPIPCTVLICASWEVICELSAGLVGSWFCNCVTSSVRKVFCRSAAEGALAEDEDDDDVRFMLLSSVCETVEPPMVVLVVTIRVLGCVGFGRFRRFGLSGADGERLE